MLAYQDVIKIYKNDISLKTPLNPRLTDRHITKFKQKEGSKKCYTCVSAHFIQLLLKKLCPNPPTTWCKIICGKLVLDTVSFPPNIFHVVLHNIHIESDSRSLFALPRNKHRRC